VVLEPGFVVEGRVIDAGAKGVAGALVTAYRSADRLTDGTGNFRFEALSPGRKSFQVRKEGFMNFRKSFSVKEGMEPLEFTLKAEEGHYIAGTAENDRGEAVAGLKLTASQSEGGNHVTKTCTTGEEGAFRFEGLAQGTARVRADWNRGRPREESKLIPVDTSDTKWVIERYGCVKGSVKNGAGEPAPAFDAMAYLKDNWRGGAGYLSFEEGTFELDRVLPGEVVVYAHTENGEYGASKPFDLMPGETREGIEITLTDKGTLSGVVRDLETLKPVAGASVYAGRHLRRSASYREPYGPCGTSEEDGSYIIENVDVGQVNVVAVHPDYSQGYTEGVTVYKNQETSEVEVYLARGCAITGYVYAHSQCKAGVQVEARASRGGRHKAVSGKDGSYRIMNVTPGTYRVQATLKDEADRSIRLERSIEVYEGQWVPCDFDFLDRISVMGMVYLYDVPVQGVQIRAYARRSGREVPPGTVTNSSYCKSEANGGFEVMGLYPGRYSLSASYRDRGGSFSAHEEVVVGEGTAFLVLRLGEGETGEVFGYVFRNGMPLSGHTVRLSGKGCNKQVKTDGGGFFRAVDVPAGSVQLMMYLPQQGSRNFYAYGQYSKNLRLEPGQILQEDIHLHTGTGVLCGSVMRNGNREGWGRITVKGAGGKAQEGVTCHSYTEDGKFRLENMAPGLYALQIDQPWPMVRTAYVYDHQETQVDFDYLTGSASLSGRVKKPKEKEKTGDVKAYLFPPGRCPWQKGGTYLSTGADQGIVARLNSDGRFTLRNLPSGHFDMVALRVKGQKILNLDLKRVSLSEGRETAVDLQVDG
jgi:hypothetical protein